MNPRIRKLNQQDFNPEGKYFVYWAQVNRRVSFNQGLDYAIDLANQASLPLLVYEEISCSYRYANDRFHIFMLEGVADLAKAARTLGAGYVFHLQLAKSQPKDTFLHIVQNARAIVADDYPVSTVREYNRKISQKVSCSYFVADSSCIIPMSLFEKREYAAYTIRPKIKKFLPQWLVAPEKIRLKQRWKEQQPFSELHTEVEIDQIPSLIASSEINHQVRPSTEFRGGAASAARQLKSFLKKSLFRYAGEKNEPSAHATSNMSPYLHFGHISALEIALAVRAYAEEHKLIADEYLEELIVRRELAFNFLRYTKVPVTLSDLPEWAQKTLRAHDGDPRSHTYSLQEFEFAETHDALWNACQKELLIRGKIHGYYRMYWGKKIIEWATSHQEALEIMIHLHDHYALDGRDPNTYTNILWCFGLHDRPWGERPVFGQIRWMSLEGMRRKTDVDAYIREIETL